MKKIKKYFVLFIFAVPVFYHCSSYNKNASGMVNPHSYPSAAVIDQSRSEADLWEWNDVKINGMGWITGIVAAPSGIMHGAGQMYARTDVGGAYRYMREGNNGNGSWEQMMDGSPFGYENYWAATVESLAVDPQNGNTVYMAGNGLAPVGGEVYKSVDAGRTWIRTGLEARPGVFMDGNDAENAKISASGSRHFTGERLAVDPQNSKNVYFASRRDGVWRYNGANWTKIQGGRRGLPQSTASPGFTFVAFDPGSGVAVLNGANVTATLYVGLYGEGVYRSTDGGISFSLMPSETRKPQVLRGAVNQNGILIVTFGHCSGAGESSGVLSAGRTGSRLTLQKRADSVDRITYSGIAVNPHDQSFAVLPGDKKYPLFLFDENGNFLHSLLNRDGIQPVYQNTPWAHSERGGAVFDPMEENVLLSGTGFGIVRAKDVNKSNDFLVWDDHTDGVSELGIFQVKTAPVAGGFDLHFGCFDMGGFSVPTRDAVPQSRLCEVNTVSTAPEWGVPLTGITGIDYSYRYPEYLVYSGWHEFGMYTDWAVKFGTSKDGGRTWNEISIPEREKEKYGLAVPETAGRIAISSTNPLNIVWAPSGGIIRYSRDFGLSWQDGSKDLIAGGAAIDGTFGPVSGKRNAVLFENSLPYWGATQNLAADKQNGNFYLFTSQGQREMNGSRGAEIPQLWRSQNGGENWELIYTGFKGSWHEYNRAKGAEDQLCSGGLPFTNVRTHPTQAGAVFVCVRPNDTHYDRAQEFFPLWRSRNADTNAVTFERVNGVDACIDVSFGAGTAYHTPYIYIFGKANGDSCFGIYVSKDDGENWSRISDEAHQFGQVSGIEADMRYCGLVYVYTLGRGIVYGQYKTGSGQALEIYSADWRDSHEGLR